MLVETKAYGAIELDERQRIFFPKGLLGFETLKEFVLMDAAQQPFYWLQSLDLVDVAFVLIDPKIFRPDYVIDPSEDDFNLLKIEQGALSQILTFSIVSFHNNNKDMTANLQGPIAINRDKKIGCQCISKDPRWKTRHDIAKELASNGAKTC